MTRAARAYRRGQSSGSVSTGWGLARPMSSGIALRALEDAGAKVSEIQARLGHESLATTGRYLAALRADENPHADALAALSSWMPSRYCGGA
jgi:integrase